MRIIVAPDSFKGSLTADEVAAAIAAGWRDRRPKDEVIELPLAGGGEGTVAALRRAVGEARSCVVARVSGPDGRPVDVEFIMLPDGCAVVELAASSGLPLMGRLDPLHASTRGLGEVLAAAVEAGATRLMVGLGGSATTDGGAGALVAMGLELRDADGNPAEDGGAGLGSVSSIETSGLIEPPCGGVQLLTDVDNPLLGPRGSAAVFGPQKGAGAAEIAALDAALSHWAGLLGGNPSAPGSGAAGGAAYGLATLWGARLVSGSDFVAELAGLDQLLEGADLVITGEGSFDRSSLSGKVVGGVLQRAGRHGVPVCVITGRATDLAPPGVVATISLTGIAGSVSRAFVDPAAHARKAGDHLARRAEDLARRREDLTRTPRQVAGAEAVQSNIETWDANR